MEVIYNDWREITLLGWGLGNLVLMPIVGYRILFFVLLSSQLIYS